MFDATNEFNEAWRTHGNSKSSRGASALCSGELLNGEGHPPKDNSTWQCHNRIHKEYVQKLQYKWSMTHIHNHFGMSSVQII